MGANSNALEKRSSLSRSIFSVRWYLSTSVSSMPLVSCNSCVRSSSRASVSVSCARLRRAASSTKMNAQRAVKLFKTPKMTELRLIEPKLANVAPACAPENW